MKPFLDSTDAVDGAELLRRIRRHGYLFIRGLLPVDELEQLRMQLLEIALEGGWVKTGTRLEEAIADQNGFCLEPEPRYMLMYQKMYKLQSFHALQHHDRLMGLFERMLDEPVMVHPRVIGRTIFPKREAYTTPPHQDFVPIQGNARHVLRVVPLHRSDSGDGRAADCCGFAQVRSVQFSPRIGGWWT